MRGRFRLGMLIGSVKVLSLCLRTKDSAVRAGHSPPQDLYKAWPK